jgi:hypothetical protein
MYVPYYIYMYNLPVALLAFTTPVPEIEGS